ncbi:hypothetical protein SGUI_1100 [Serinicoccus hydrothermalis]|uniref:Methyltransferase domain-containing protein n=1 Tax=Serinicoccus hydrothermalis TaxID=1758689 RepID=A0A1B1NAN4_9MICO|nr:methyltransferase domain-containing protein [Serinicoccus hydrothermalis]ANS78496.1 hypothetical protein SGUI_1100 [Serinicoccus hydrothermalis]
MSHDVPLARRAAEALWLSAALAETGAASRPPGEAQERLRTLAAARWGGADQAEVPVEIRRALRRALGEVTTTIGGEVTPRPEDQLETGLESGAEVMRILADLSHEDTGLGELLDHDFRLLDVGTGVGGVASSVALKWPGSTVRGIDVDPAVLELARHVVRSRGCTERVRLDHADVVDLDAQDVYDLVWLSLPMIGQDEAPPALRAVARCLGHDGRVVLATVSDEADVDDVLQLARAWRLSVQGRCRWTAQQALDAAAALGLEPRARLDQHDAHVTLVSLARRT